MAGNPNAEDFGGLTWIAKDYAIATKPGATATTIISSTGALTPVSLASTGAVSGTSGTFTGPVRSSTVTTLSQTSPATLTATLGEVFKSTPNATLTINAASAPAGQPLYIVFLTSGTSSFTVTFGTNFKTTGTLATGTADAKTFVVSFISDGTNFCEVARTAAM